MNDIQVFSNEKFGQVRTVMQDGEPWFVAKDVCDALEIRSDTVRAILDPDEVMETNPNTIGVAGGRNPLIISEPGLYSLALKSRKKEAKDFKRWITHEVIPAIRKTGGYVHNSEVFIDNYLPFADDATKQLFRLTLDVVDKQNKQIASQQKELAEKSSVIEEMTPKATYYDLVINSPDLTATTIIAKDYGKSATWLNRFLNEKGVQYRSGRTWVLYQKYADSGYAQTKTYVYSGKANADKHVSINTFWTQKGRMFIYGLLKDTGILPIVEREAV